MSTDIDKPVKVFVLSMAGRKKCRNSGCRNPARTILSYVDAGGRSLRQENVCINHRRIARARAIAAGLVIHDQQKSRPRKE